MRCLPRVVVMPVTRRAPCLNDDASTTIPDRARDRRNPASIGALNPAWHRLLGRMTWKRWVADKYCGGGARTGPAPPGVGGPQGARRGVAAARREGRRGEEQ